LYGGYCSHGLGRTNVFCFLNILDWMLLGCVTWNPQFGWQELTGGEAWENQGVYLDREKREWVTFFWAHCEKLLLTWLSVYHYYSPAQPPGEAGVISKELDLDVCPAFDCPACEDAPVNPH
jgi:hypothetical protein